MKSSGGPRVSADPFGAAWRAVLAAALCAGLACSLSTAIDPGLQPGTRTGRGILFIGNSLTYVNDMPLILEAMGDSSGGPALAVTSIAQPNFSLEDHITNGAAQKAIDQGGWEVIVLQQGPSSLPENRDNLRQATAIFAERIRKVNARPALYGVWPTIDRQGDFDASIESYRLAAEDVDGMLFPVGAAWLAAWRRDPTIPLYASDGLHPSLYGSYLAAAVMYARIYNRSPVGLPDRLRLRTGNFVSIPPVRATMLQAAAAEVTGLGGP